MVVVARVLSARAVGSGFVNFRSAFTMCSSRAAHLPTRIPEQTLCSLHIIQSRHMAGRFVNSRQLASASASSVLQDPHTLTPLTMTIPQPVASTASEGPRIMNAGLQPTEAAVQAALALKEHGWAVIPDVIPPTECAAYIDRVWEWLEGLGTGIKRGDPSTWADEAWPGSFGSGIVNTLEVAHQDFVWKMRSDPRITSIFAALWGTDALLSSFDSINVMRPTSVTGSKNKSWWHTDQAPSRRGMECVQGLLNLSDNCTQSGTLMVREGSHAAHQRFWAEHSEMPAAEQAALGDFYPFKPHELEYWDAFRERTLRGYGPGSLFLWDSRTVHQNCPPADPAIWRHVLYTCYQPAALASEADLALKRQAYQQYRCTTHWPATNIAMTAPASEEELRTFRRRRTRSLVEDDPIRQLAGVRPYTSERRCPPLLGASAEALSDLLANLRASPRGPRFFICDIDVYCADLGASLLDALSLMPEP